MAKLPTDEEIMFDDANERFVGDVIDPKKMERLNTLRSICQEISEREPRIKYKAYPFSNRSQNAMAVLEFPDLLFCANSRVLSLISKALTTAEDMTTTTLAGGLRVVFGIQNMWTDFHIEQI